MTVYLVRQGFKQSDLMDMDHVSFTALHDMTKKQDLDEAAQQMELDSVAAQADRKGITSVADKLRDAAGTGKPKSLDAFKKFVTSR